MPYTKNQKEAIEFSGKNVLVSASAGSGKTGVLKERVINKLKNGVNIDELVILTFTEAAALEMKSRIVKEIYAQNLLSQIQYVDNAIISTFDAFTLRLVREYHYLLGMDSKIGISDNVIIEKRKKEIIESVIKRYYENNSDDFRNLFKKYFNRSDQWLYDMVKKVSDQITKQPDYFNIVDNYEEIFLTEDFKENLVNEYIDDLRQELAFIYRKFDDEWYSKTSAFDINFQEYLASINALMFELLAEKDSDILINKINTLKFPRKPSNKDLDKPEIIDQMKVITDELNSLYSQDSKDLLFGLNTTVPSVKTLMNIIKDFLSAFESCKKEENLYSFEDIMYLAIKLFQDFPDVKNKFRNKIKEILVDEYQDTNDLQDSFIQLIADNNVFMVGDVKQSIYRFRDANPKNFVRIYDDYLNNAGGKAIFLQENFRSNRFVLDSINRIFKKAMTRRTGGIDYQGQQVLISGYPDDHKFHDEDAFSILLYDKDKINEEHDLEKVEIEAHLIAQDIVKRIENKEVIIDALEKEKIIDYSDITILVSQKGDFAKFKKIFARYNIPLDIYDDQPFFESDEIRFVFQFLLLVQSVNNEEFFQRYFKTALYSVARSFVYQIKDNVMIKLFAQNDFKSCEEFLVVQRTDEITRIYADIIHISENYLDKPIAELLEAVYQRIKIYRMLSYLDNPETREKRLDFFALKVKELENYDFLDLISYLETIIENDDIDIQYSEEKTKVNAVKLMSMHKSKGLQFPICYLAQMYKQFFFDENKDPFVFNKNYGLLTKAYDEGFYHSFVQKLLFREIAKENYSERIRLLYVAMTRAINKIIICLDYDERLLEKSFKIRSFKDLLYDALAIDKINPVDFEIPETDAKITINISEGMALEQRKLEFDKKSKTNKKYSKDITYLLDDETIDFVKAGTRFHHLLETIDFNNWEASIVNFPESLKEAVMSLVKTDLFKNFKNPRFLKEHEFYQEDINVIRRGVIDLLIIDDDQVITIDYKLKNMEDEAYNKQLKGYYDYLQPKFAKKVRLFLYSLADKALKEISL